MLDSLRKSYNNCMKGNWDNLSEKDLKTLIEYQIEEFCRNEEDLSFEEIDTAKQMINDIINKVKVINPTIQIEMYA